MTHRCFVCSASFKKWGQALPVDDRLSREWGLDKKELELYQIREGKYCPVCHNSIRTIGLSKVLANSLLEEGSDSFYELIKYANQKRLKIAEINGCGNLHKFLKEIKGLHYSEYGTGNLNGVRKEDIQKLSYDDNSFDIVLHSETLEHIPNPGKALSECNRILKPNGWCFFTVPVIWNRETVERIVSTQEGLKFKKSKSYHGGGKEDCIVWNEFGYDFAINNNVKVFIDDFLSQSYVFGFSKNSKYKTPNIFLLKKLELIARLLVLKKSITPGVV
jgi:SAM-dependent methyltransferase